MADPLGRRDDGNLRLLYAPLLVVIAGFFFGNPAFAQQAHLEKAVDVRMEYFFSTLVDLKGYDRIFPEFVKDVKVNPEKKTAEFHVSTQGIQKTVLASYSVSEDSFELDVVSGEFKGSHLEISMSKRWGFDGTKDGGTKVVAELDLSMPFGYSLFVSDENVRHGLDMAVWEVAQEAKKLEPQKADADKDPDDETTNAYSQTKTTSESAQTASAVSSGELKGNRLHQTITDVTKRVQSQIKDAESGLSGIAYEDNKAQTHAQKSRAYLSSAKDNLQIARDLLGEAEKLGQDGRQERSFAKYRNAVDSLERSRDNLLKYQRYFEISKHVENEELGGESQNKDPMHDNAQAPDSQEHIQEHSSKIQDSSVNAKDKTIAKKDLERQQLQKQDKQDDTKKNNFIRVSDTSVSVSRHKDAEIAIAGKLDEYSRGQKMVLVIKSSDGAKQKLSTPVAKSGNYGTMIRLDGSSPVGSYKVDAKLNGETVASASFMVTDSEKAKKEYLVQSKEEMDFKKAAPIPEWIKTNAGWWSEGKIDDSTFISTMEHLVRNGLISVSKADPTGLSVGGNIPEWAKLKAGQWSDGKITDENFVEMIEYLVDEGIVSIKQ